jgi:transposase
MSKNVVREIRQASRKRYTSEEKIRIVLEGLRGVIPVKELCRREGLTPVTYYKWSKSFLDAGKNGLTLDTKRDATTDEVRHLKEEVDSLKRAVAEQVLENQRLKKSLGL